MCRLVYQPYEVASNSYLALPAALPYRRSGTIALTQDSIPEGIVIQIESLPPTARDHELHDIVGTSLCRSGASARPRLLCSGRAGQGWPSWSLRLFALFRTVICGWFIRLRFVIWCYEIARSMRPHIPRLLQPFLASRARPRPRWMRAVAIATARLKRSVCFHRTFLFKVRGGAKATPECGLTDAGDMAIGVTAVALFERYAFGKRFAAMPRPVHNQAVGARRVRCVHVA